MNQFGCISFRFIYLRECGRICRGNLRSALALAGRDAAAADAGAVYIFDRAVTVFLRNLWTVAICDTCSVVKQNLLQLQELATIKINTKYN